MATAVTRLGELKGTDHDGYERYAGIRYAQAPVGTLRFQPPAPVEAWDGVYDATAFGASSFQMPPAPGAIGVQRDLTLSEDCLFLNVFTPRADDGARPVLVWIHGGAYTLGSGDTYDGAAFVTRGDVVVVTINYRLGVLGWTPLDHLDASLVGSGNNGLRDQIEALRWVRDNIAAFGGDPSNITIFGESAGGGSVGAILAAPSADGLYAKAIIQSGAVNFDVPAQKAEYTDALLDKLGASGGGIDAFRNADPAALAQAQAGVGIIERIGRDPENPIDGRGSGPRPVVDGVVVTRTLPEAIRHKAENNVPLVIGTNLDEGTLFAMLLPTVEADEVVGNIGPSASNPQAVVDATVARNSGRKLTTDLMTDAIFRQPALRAADAQAETDVPVWVYLFTWATPVFGGLFGATHALEIPFVWGMAGDPMWTLLLGDDVPLDLGVAMQDAWLSFARTGDPGSNWPRYDTTTRPTMEFGTEVRVVNDPESDLRIAWS